jgi:pilus assembly protein CpaE
MAKNLEVLIVDQDEEQRFELRRMLRQAGLTICGESGFGTEAVSLAAEKRPDVVLCGLSEPLVRPLQTIEGLFNALPETPVVTYSANTDVEMVRQAMIVGARDFLVVPTTTKELRKSLMSALEAEERRRLRFSGEVTEVSTRGNVITMFGAKGGIGKTTLAVNLASALAHHFSQSVALVDADTGFGDVTAMLDLEPERTIVELVREFEAVDRNELPKYLTEHENGLRVLAAPIQAGQWRQVTPAQLKAVVDLMAKSHDVVIVDTAGMLNEYAKELIDTSDIVLWLTSTEFASLKDSIQAMEELRSMSMIDERVRVMLNFVSPDDPVRASSVADVLHHKVFWQIPYDRRVRQQTQRGEPVVSSHPRSPAARSLIDLAAALGGRTREKKSWLPPVPFIGKQDKKQPAQPVLVEEGSAS